ncbi:uncharacterized protein LOC132611940 [Lycium barbarum]|uniref:uncharacterized protein LOC132611940 n=1 Tax=Lycium barbarum TaxID=112863 RepID=UPI00293E6AFE|nr:uncharacterized protein LOC132611940 [Lycium barbarum]
MPPKNPFKRGGGSRKGRGQRKTTFTLRDEPSDSERQAMVSTTRLRAQDTTPRAASPTPLSSQSIEGSSSSTSADASEAATEQPAAPKRNSDEEHERLQLQKMEVAAIQFPYEGCRKLAQVRHIDTFATTLPATKVCDITRSRDETLRKSQATSTSLLDLMDEQTEHVMDSVPQGTGDIGTEGLSTTEASTSSVVDATPSSEAPPRPAVPSSSPIPTSAAASASEDLFVLNRANFRKFAITAERADQQVTWILQQLGRFVRKEIAPELEPFQEAMERHHARVNARLDSLEMRILTIEKKSECGNSGDLKTELDRLRAEITALRTREQVIVDDPTQPAPVASISDLIRVVDLPQGQSAPPLQSTKPAVERAPIITAAEETPQQQQQD